MWNSNSVFSPVIDLEYVTIQYEEPVVHLIFKVDVELGFPQIRELTLYAEKLSDNKPYLVFSDVRATVKVTPEGRRVVSNIKEAPLHRGSAVLVNSSMLKMAVNFFSEYQKPLFPYRAFTDRQKALDWLSTLALRD